MNTPLSRIFFHIQTQVRNKFFVVLLFVLIPVHLFLFSFSWNIANILIFMPNIMKRNFLVQNSCKVCNYLLCHRKQVMIFSARYIKKRLLHLVSVKTNLLISKSVTVLSLFIFLQLLKKQNKQDMRRVVQFFHSGKSIKCRKANNFNTTSQRWSDRPLSCHGELQHQWSLCLQNNNHNFYLLLLHCYLYPFSSHKRPKFNFLNPKDNCLNII